MAKVTGQGSIVQLEKGKPRGKCRKWQLRVSVGMDPRTGRYRQRTKAFHGSYTEAKRGLRDFIEDIEGNRCQGRTDYTLEGYCEHYLSVRRSRGNLASSTLRRIEGQLRGVCGHIGKLKLEKVTTADINEMVTEMMAGDTPTGTPSGGAYTRQVCNVTKAMFAMAVSEGLLTGNPCTGVVLPKNDVRPKDALPLDKVRELVGSLDPTNPHELAYLLALTMGLRRSEICALSWGDVDWSERLLRVYHSYDSDSPERLKKPKTPSGRRVLPLSDVTYDSLAKAKEAQRREFARISERRAKRKQKRVDQVVQDDSTAIVTNYIGERVTPGGLEGWWKYDRGVYGLEGYKFHGLRHTYLSILAQLDVHPKVMQALAGHSSCVTTLNIYTHDNMAMREKAAESFSSLFEENSA